MLVKFIFFTLSLFLIVFLSSAQAAEQNDKNISTTLTNSLTNDLTEIGVKSVGSAKFTFLFWDIYNSQLFTQTGKYNSDKLDNTIYQIEYLKDIEASELIKRTVEQWQHLKIDKQAYQHFIPLLSDIWPDIKAGDALTLFIHQHGSTFYFNNEKIGTITDKNFGRLFLDIWLSPDTSEPSLRANLIGENNEKPS